MATQTLTIDGAGTTTSGWAAEGGDYTRLQSDDGDTSRLYSPTNNDVYQCTLTNTSGLSGKTINSITVHAKVKSLDPVNNTMQIGIRTGSTDYYSANKDTNPNNTTYIDFTETWTTNPNTSVAWTTSDLDALQMGLKKTNGAGMRWSYGYVDVDYTDSSPVSVTPGIATLTLTAQTPTVTTTNNIAVTPGIATLTLTARTPTVTATNSITLTPGTASLTTTRLTPTVTVSANQTLTPGTASLVTSLFTPTVATTNNQFVTPGVATLTLTAFTPTVTVPTSVTVTPGVLALVLSAFAPTVTVITPSLESPIVSAIQITQDPLITIGISQDQAVSVRVVQDEDALSITQSTSSITIQQIPGASL